MRCVNEEVSNLLKELLQISLGSRNELSRAPSVLEWSMLYNESQRQAITGILLSGVQRLMTQANWCMVNMPKEIIIRWIGASFQIERQNVLASAVCADIIGKIENDGLRCCLLKGQSNHRYYPVDLAARRSCGDVDLWVSSSGDSRSVLKDNISRVLKYVDAHYKRDGLCWLHCRFMDKSGVPVEVHFFPSFFNSPKYNKRFQRYFCHIDQCVERSLIDGVEIPTMKVGKDVIYQMNHIYRHLIDEGVGLRQIIDYYWLLFSWNERRDCSKEEIMKTISYLGMRRFAGALMYVLREACGMDCKLLLCPSSKKDGEFFLNEVLTAGNFGQSDYRMSKLASRTGLRRQLSQVQRRFMRNLRFLTSYPGEVFWEPFTRARHFAWKIIAPWKW